jgi:PKD repeat protein
MNSPLAAIIRHRLALALLAAVALTGCTVGKQSAPSLTGPSEFGLSVTMTASPDQLPRDGSAQSVVTLTARDASGKPAAGQRFTVAVSGASGVTVSQSEVMTGNDGRATFAVSAPPADALGGSIITIVATPIGGNFDNAVPRSMTIALLGPPNATAPSPAFTVTPGTPEVKQVATFDASPTTDEGSSCGDACTYTWDFDDGSTATGIRVSHAFQVARAFNVALTVRDAAGLTVTARQLVSVAAAAAPVVTVAVAPNPPLLNQVTTFTADATVAPNHTAMQYSWNFGDGTSATTGGPTVTKTYSSPGTYVTTVTVTDDLGQTGVASTSFTVASGIAPTFTMSPTNPRTGDTVNFNASGSTSSSGATITQFTWDFGDGATASGATATHAFATARTFIVRLTVSDSLGRTATTTQSLTVQ